MLNKADIKLCVISSVVGLAIGFGFRLISGAVVENNITKQKAQIEAELQAQGLLPRPEKRRPKRDIYIPIDRTGQQNRADSTEMFRQSAERTFGAKHEAGLEIVDYGSQVEDYQQRVDAVKKAEAERLARRQAQQEALNIKTGANSAARRANASAGGTESGTRINKLKTSSLKSSSSGR